MEKEIRNSIYAMYKGKDFKADKELETGRIILFSRDPQDKLDGFIEYAEQRFKKEVDASEIEQAYSILTYSLYKGYKFQLLTGRKEGTGRLVHYGDDSEIQHLEFEWSEPMTYEKVVKLDELDSIFEEKTPIWDF